MEKLKNEITNEMQIIKHLEICIFNVKIKKIKYIKIKKHLMQSNKCLVINNFKRIIIFHLIQVSIQPCGHVNHVNHRSAEAVYLLLGVQRGFKSNISQYSNQYLDYQPH